MTKRVLQIGWRPRGTSALRRLGCDVDILIDAGSWDWYAYPGWPGESANVLITEDFNSSEHLAFRLGRLLRDGLSYDAVVGFDEYSLIPAWQAAKILGLPGLDWQLVVRMRDKSAQKSALREGGIACAEWWLIDDIRRQSEEVQALSEHLPLVLKPYSGAATVHTFVARSVSELREAVDRFAATPKRTVIIETYVSGTEHHADGIVHDGGISVFSLGEYLDNLIHVREGVTPGSITVSAATAPEPYQEARELISQALSCLGLRNGVFHAEMFRTPDGWVFSETAMRVGGGGIALYHETIGGLDLHESVARVQLGLPPHNGHNGAGTTPPVTGWTFLPGPPGIVRDFPSREEVLKQEGVLDAEFDTHPGQELGSGTADTFTRVGSAVLAAATRQEFIDRQQRLTSWFQSNVKVDRPAQP